MTQQRLLLLGQFPATLSSSDLHLHFLKLRYLARYGDPTRMMETILPLCLPQKLSKQRMIEVDDRNQKPMRVVVFLADVDGQVAFRDRDRLWVERSPVKAGVSRLRSRAELLGEAATPVADFRHCLGFWIVGWA